MHILFSTHHIYIFRKKVSVFKFHETTTRKIQYDSFLHYLKQCLFVNIPSVLKYGKKEQKIYKQMTWPISFFLCSLFQGHFCISCKNLIRIAAEHGVWQSIYLSVCLLPYSSVKHMSIEVTVYDCNYLFSSNIEWKWYKICLFLISGLSPFSYFFHSFNILCANYK